MERIARTLLAQGAWHHYLGGLGVAGWYWRHVIETHDWLRQLMSRISRCSGPLAGNDTVTSNLQFPGTSLIFQTKDKQTWKGRLELCAPPLQFKKNVQGVGRRNRTLSSPSRPTTKTLLWLAGRILSLGCRCCLSGGLCFAMISLFFACKNLLISLF